MSMIIDTATQRLKAKRPRAIGLFPITPRKYKFRSSMGSEWFVPGGRAVGGDVTSKPCASQFARSLEVGLVAP